MLRTFSLFFIGLYRSVFRFWLSGSCRYQPSCSEYGYKAFKKFSFIKAFTLTSKRIIRCRPGSSFGYDPLPEEHSHGK